MTYINPRLANVHRTNAVNAVPKRPIGHRLHACERTEMFGGLIWDQFKHTLSQDDFINYPDDQELKQKLADYHGVSVDNILLFSGADGALSCAFQCFTGPHSRVLMPEFHFPMYDVYVAQKGCEPNFLLYDKMRLTGSTLVEAIKIDLIVIANPNSPMGDSPDHDLLEELESYGAPIVVDSVYSDFGCTKVNVIEKLAKRYIFVHSFSKSFGGAGARVGYAIASASIIEIMSKMRPMFSTTGPSIKFALWCLENVDLMQTYVRHIVDIRDMVNTKYPYNIGGNWLHLPYDKFADKLTAAGFTFKDNCYLPSVTSERLIRVSAASTLLDFL